MDRLVRRASPGALACKSSAGRKARTGFDSRDRGDRQLLIETFAKSTAEEYWTEISVDATLQGSMLTDIGIVTASGIDYSHRRWIVSETLSVESTDRYRRVI